MKVNEYQEEFNSLVEMYKCGLLYKNGEVTNEDMETVITFFLISFEISSDIEEVVDRFNDILDNGVYSKENGKHTVYYQNTQHIITIE